MSLWCKYWVVTKTFYPTFIFCDACFIVWVLGLGLATVSDFLILDLFVSLSEETFIFSIYSKKGDCLFSCTLTFS
jgi:hypothetical protein